MSEFVCVPQRADTDAESKVSVNSDTASVSEAEKVQNTNTNSSQVEENSNELLKGLLTDNFCHVCDATLLFDSQRISHYEGRKHAQRVRLYLQSKRTEGLSQNPVSNQRALSQDREKFCGLCNMVFSSAVVAKSHYEGKVHAKNLKRNNLPPSSDVLPQLSAAFPNPGLREGAVRGAGDEAMGAPEQGTQQEVDLSDPNKYCSLCTASFNNPLMAQQHYSGRKHQRNHARQQLLSQLGDDDPDRVSSLTCPVCCVTLSSVETYQAHMQGNKHHIKEKKVINLCKSQRKVYDSFQDELADYIQVQKARGLEPRTGSEGQAEREELEEEILCPAEDFQTQGAPLRPDPLLHNPPAATAVPPPSWCPPFQSPTNQFGSGGRGMGPRPHLWGQGYPVQPPPLIPGLTGRVFNRVRSPDSYSSSSFSDSSSYSSNRSSSSSSDNSKERRRWRKKRRERKRREYEGEEEEETERKGTKRKRTREGEGEYDAKRARRREHGRGVSLEEEEVVKEDEKRNNQRGRRRREVSSVDEEEEERRRRRVLGKRNKKQRERNHGDGHHGDKHDSKRKRGEAKEQRREGREITTETDMDKVAEMESEQTQDRMEGSRTERVEMKEGRGKHRKEKKRTKEKMDGDDMRTEEEKLWDETILGVF